MNGLPSASAAINAMRTKSDTANTRGAQWRRSQWRRWTRKAKVLAQMASGSTGCSRSPCDGSMRQLGTFISVEPEVDVLRMPRSECNTHLNVSC